MRRCPTPVQSMELILKFWAFLCSGVCLLGGLALLIFKFGRKEQGDDPVPTKAKPPLLETPSPEEIAPPEEKASE